MDFTLRKIHTNWCVFLCVDYILRICLVWAYPYSQSFCSPWRWANTREAWLPTENTLMRSMGAGVLGGIAVCQTLKSYGWCMGTIPPLVGAYLRLQKEMSKSNMPDLPIPIIICWEESPEAPIPRRWLVGLAIIHPICMATLGLNVATKYWSVLHLAFHIRL